MQLHAPTHGPLRAAQDSLLDDLYPSGNGDLEGALLAKSSLDRLLCRRPSLRGSLGPTDVLRANGRGIPPLQHGRELPLEPGVLDAVSLRDRALRRLLCEVRLRQNVERFALVATLRLLVGGFFDRDRIALGRPRQNSYEVPALVELDFVELRERRRASRSSRLPDLDLPCDADGPGVARHDLDREVVQTLDLAGVWRNFDRHVELPALFGREDLLTDEVDQAFALLILGHYGEVGIDAQERDLVGSDLRCELPLVEREIPVRFVENDFARPGNWVLDACFYEILGETPPSPLLVRSS